MPHFENAAKSTVKAIPGLRTVARAAIAYENHRQRKKRAYREAAMVASASNQHPPVIVYQMSKVGSRTVYESLSRLNLPNPICHIHFISPGYIAELKERYTAAKGRLKVPEKLFLGLKLWEHIQSLGKSRTYRIVTLVRDPIAREVSSTFTVPHLHGIPQDNGEIAIERCLQILTESLSKPDAGAYGERWFERELETVFGVDVFAHDFDVEKGYQIISQDNVKVLVLRTEDMDSTMGRGLAELLALEAEAPVLRSNTRNESHHADGYAEIQRRIRIPRDQCERVYSGKLLRHFYSPEMIRGFVDKWSCADG